MMPVEQRCQRRDTRAFVVAETVARQCTRAENRAVLAYLTQSKGGKQ